MATCIWDDIDMWLGNVLDFHKNLLKYMLHNIIQKYIIIYINIGLLHGYNIYLQIWGCNIPKKLFFDIKINVYKMLNFEY